jgi:hypothetical protein
MEHVDNNMDDLFRKAGNLYPLKTSSESDWDAVMDKLKESTDNDAVPGDGTNKNFIKRRWALLLLLIPVGLGAVLYFSPGKKLKPGSASDIAGNKADNKTIPISTTPGEKINSHGAYSSASDNSASDSKKPETVYKENRIDAGKNGLARRYEKERAYSRAGLDNHDETGVASELTNDVPATNNGSSLSEKSSAENEFKIKLLSLSPVTHPDENISVSSKLHTATGTDVSPASLTKRIECRSISTRGFYAGLLIGPDISSVHFQSVEQTGLSLGVLVGYRLNTRLSVESGLMWDKKYYYSTGEYFKKNQTGIPPNVSILNLNGSCNMFEIPVSLRYDFSTTVNHGFFVKAGLSTYLMKKENYNYQAEYAGGAQWPETATYYNSSNNIFSVIAVSAGYERSIGINGKTKIRIEPYLRVPTQGMGVGSLPVSSAGVYLGITHSFR